LEIIQNFINNNNKNNNIIINSYEIIENNNTEVWKVDWNSVGSILSVSDDSGNVKLYKWNGSKWKSQSLNYK